MPEDFLKRWSRLKSGLPAAADAVPAASGQAGATTSTAATLPALDSLDFSSDFTAFMQGDVDECLRKAALQQLFHDEHFNVMDGLDVYIDDYHSFEPISSALLQNLNQARGLLFADGQKPVAAETGAAEGAVEAEADAPGDANPLPESLANSIKDQG